MPASRVLEVSFLTSYCTNLSSLYFRIAGGLHTLDRYAYVTGKARMSIYASISIMLGSWRDQRLLSSNT